MVFRIQTPHVVIEGPAAAASASLARSRHVVALDGGAVVICLGLGDMALRFYAAWYCRGRLIEAFDRELCMGKPSFSGLGRMAEDQAEGMCRGS
jgi:hypothetical protein